MTAAGEHATITTQGCLGQFGPFSIDYNVKAATTGLPLVYFHGLCNMDPSRPPMPYDNLHQNSGQGDYPGASAGSEQDQVR